MTKKTKKHSPTQTETEQSVVEQIPDNKMDDFIKGLVQLAQSRKEAKEAQKDNPEGQPSQPRTETNFQAPPLRKNDAEND